MSVELSPRPARKPVCPQRRTAADHLRAALLALSGGHARIASHREKSWASVTFAGAHHRLDLLFDGPQAVAAGEIFLAELPEHEFEIPGQLVADAAICEVDHRMLPAPRLAVSIELLLLEEA